MNPAIRILLVDDSPYFLDVAREYLDLQESFEITGVAVEGRNALEQARQLQPDIILLDLNLGDQSGVRLIPLLKRHAPHSKIIVLTIMDGEGYRVAAMQAGVDMFDSAVGNLGGCQFAKGATGNVSTEQLVYLLNGMGIETGIDYDRIVVAGRIARSLIAV